MGLDFSTHKLVAVAGDPLILGRDARMANALYLATSKDLLLGLASAKHPEHLEPLLTCVVQDKAGRTLGEGQPGLLMADDVMTTYRAMAKGEKLILMGSTERSVTEDILPRTIREMPGVIYFRVVTPNDPKFILLAKAGNSQVVNRLLTAIEKTSRGQLGIKNLMALERLPLTTRGTLNTDTISFTRNRRAVNTFQPPITQGEKRLATIWREELQVERVGRFDNFFDLGGHSLLPLLVCRRVEKETGIYPDLSLFLSGNLMQIASVAGYPETKVQEAKP